MLWFAWLGYLPVAFPLGVLLSLLFPCEHAILVVAGPWLMLCAIAGYRLTTFPCPRCHRPFFRTWFYTNQFAGRCIHCGLPKWSETQGP